MQRHAKRAALARLHRPCGGPMRGWAAFPSGSLREVSMLEPMERLRKKETEQSRYAENNTSRSGSAELNQSLKDEVNRD